MDISPLPGTVGENAARITPEQDENGAPNVQSLLVVGDALPSLISAGCNVPTQIFHHLPRYMVVQYSPNDESFPSDFLDLNRENWKQ